MRIGGRPYRHCSSRLMQISALCQSQVASTVFCCGKRSPPLSIHGHPSLSPFQIPRLRFALKCIGSPARPEGTASKPPARCVSPLPPPCKQQQVRSMRATADDGESFAATRTPQDRDSTSAQLKGNSWPGVQYPSKHVQLQ